MNLRITFGNGAGKRLPSLLILALAPLLWTPTAHGQNRSGIAAPGLWGASGQRSITPFATIHGAYREGLGESSGDPRFGYSAAVGVQGSQTWRRSSMALSYLGRYSDYASRTSGGNFDHVLGLSAGTRATERLDVYFGLTGCTNRY
jgi:hypothetical protein